jgi:hypothetical protein
MWVGSSHTRLGWRHRLWRIQYLETWSSSTRTTLIDTKIVVFFFNAAPGVGRKVAGEGKEGNAARKGGPPP